MHIFFMLFQRFTCFIRGRIKILVSLRQVPVKLAGFLIQPFK